jgi:hypothetical protein
VGDQDSSDQEGGVGGKQERGAAKKGLKGQAVMLNAARLIAEDAAERRVQLPRQLKKLQEMCMILSVF